eukprot:CAMPEP_0179300240 /NCGR_PEP_ID=MMETSP0797-20121207/46928_1 /TAXON_ID=47934 /ORGANISM="Dinophysis acuminata, Strain DAEP01" /LENGTH=123 /DNA_ID=CAMNT_0021009695 /DNA_START=1 /DNA_END=372 /DNA_ORIENTATION=-
MVYNVLFGSRILPQALRQGVPRASALTSRAVCSPAAAALKTARNGFTAMAPRRPMANPMMPTLAVGAPTPSTGVLARSYGTRSIWNVGKARFWLAMWIVGAAIWAGVVQEVAGPYVFFVEKES